MLNTIVFAYVRMNPPTKGHKVLIDKVLSLAAEYKCEYKIVVSHTHDHNRNPLPPEKKLEYLADAFPGVNFTLSDPSCPSMVQHLAKIDAFTLIMVAGEDRADEYDRLIAKYNGEDFYFHHWRVIAAGDATEREEISATKMRAAAVSGDFDEFARYSNSSSLSVSLSMYNDVRTSMLGINIPEQRDTNHGTEEKENYKE